MISLRCGSKKQNKQKTRLIDTGNRQVVARKWGQGLEGGQHGLGADQEVQDIQLSSEQTANVCLGSNVCQWRTQ